MDALTVLTLATADPRKILWAKGGALVHAGCISPTWGMFELLSENMPYEKQTGLISIYKAPPFSCHVCGGNVEVWEDMQTRTLHARAVD